MTNSTSPPSSSKSATFHRPTTGSEEPGQLRDARSELAWSVPVNGATCEIRSTTNAFGDFAVAGDATSLERLRRSIIDLPWTWLRQVHGTDVVEVVHQGQWAGAVADGALTTNPRVPVAVTTADCAPVVLVGSTGLAVVHAGWRGAEAGIIERAAAQLQEKGAEPVATVLAPCIGPAHYAFGSEDLSRLVRRFGPGVASLTAEGRPALDLAAVVRAACDRAGWPPPQPTACTSDDRFFSHRVGKDVGRQTTVAWMEPT